MKKTEKLLLVASAGLGLVLAVTGLPGRGKGAGHPAAPPAAAAPVAATPPAVNTAPPTLELLVTQRAPLAPVPPAMRDPFRPPNTNPPRPGDEAATAHESGAEKAAQLKLTGLLEERGELAAFINGKVVHAGDIIGGLRVEQVTSHGVWLDYHGERYFLELYKRLGPGEETGGNAPAGGREGTEPVTH
jgi:hypothetical protein